MKTIILLIFLVPGTIQLSMAQESHIYPKTNFYHRQIEVPIDHENKEQGTFLLFYELSKNFDYSRPTIFYIQDSQQGAQPGSLDQLVQQGRFDTTFNYVRHEPRGRQYSYIDMNNEDGSTDWKKVYRLMSSRQHVEDIEMVRRDLFKDHPEAKVYMWGRSGGAYLVQEYLVKHTDTIDRAFIRNTPNPTIMANLGNPESRVLINNLNAIDTTLHSKLKAVLDRETVPRLNLLWLLLQIPYGNENPAEKQAALVSELYAGNMTLYNQYLQNKRNDYSELSKRMNAIRKQMGPGLLVRPIECDSYLLGPKPAWIDPVYSCLRDLSRPIIELVETKKVAPPVYPALEDYRAIKTEVFCLMSKRDHMSPYRIGIELGKYIKNYQLFIADDNHLLTLHAECYPALRSAFFKYGTNSKGLQQEMQDIKCVSWQPEQ